MIQIRRFRSRFLLVALGFFMAAQAEAHSKHLCSGFLPKNDVKIPIDTKYEMKVQFPDLQAVPLAGGLTKTQFDAICSRVSKIYTPVIKQKGAKFKVVKLWSNPELNAYADQQGNNWTINMFGGLARHPAMGEEGFAIVACHETGHHIGGAPKIGTDWASNEGASDYFSTLKCLRYFYEGADNETWAKTANVDPIAVDSCQRQHTNRAEQLYCMRAAAGAMQIGRVFADLDQVTPPKFETPDPKVVKKTDDSHPAAQCRLDTYYNGGLCPVDKAVGVSDLDYRVGSCMQGVEARGWRPRCWFAP